MKNEIHALHTEFLDMYMHIYVQVFHSHTGHKVRHDGNKKWNYLHVNNQRNAVE